MARLKLLVYALPILALAAAHLMFVTPDVAERASEDALARARGGTVAAARSISHAMADQQMGVQSTLIKALTVPSMGGATRGRADPVTPDRWTAVKDVLEYALPDDAKADFYVGVSGYSTSLWGKVGADPGEFPEGLTLPEGGGATVVQVDGRLIQLVTIPSIPLTITAGLPLSRQPFAGVEAKVSGLDAVAFFENGKQLATQGDAQALAFAASAPAVGGAAVVESGAVEKLGPLSLPMFARGGGDSGEAALTVAAREQVKGTAIEVVGLVNARGVPQALASYQRLAALAFGALLVWTLLWLALIGRGGARSSGVQEAPLTAAPVAPAEGRTETLDEQTTRLKTPIADPVPAAEPVRAPPVASPADDFSNLPFNPSPPPAALFDDSASTAIAAPPQAPPVRPVSYPPPPAAAPPAVAAASDRFGDGDVQTTRAYPTAPSSLFGGVGPSAYDNPETTRVASIPHDLLQAAARPAAPAFGSSVEPIALPGAGGYVGVPDEATRVSSTAQTMGAEEAHFQEVYREFVSTRERCGEPADGLTYDKFVVKLKKNRDQLVEKYGAKSVRFQVYVKDGKAALKATPIK